MQVGNVISVMLPMERNLLVKQDLGWFSFNSLVCFCYFVFYIYPVHSSICFFNSGEVVCIVQQLNARGGWCVLEKIKTSFLLLLLTEFFAKKKKVRHFERHFLLYTTTKYTQELIFLQIWVCLLFILF